jgi:hypothetical protein
MKIIDIAICINNKDPENLGRIRCIRYSSYTGEVERAMSYKDWDDKDLFTANPFLPTNINFIPEIGQTVKIINYNTDKETVNSEYIAGPFTTRHDFNSQTHSIQIEKSSYGVVNKHGKKVINDDTYINPKSEAAFASHSDYGIYGKYGSDIIFTENGIQLRGGKLISKNSATNQQRTDLIYQPIMSKKNATLYLKKFDKTKEYKNEEVTKEVIKVSNINYIVEYSIDVFSGDTITIDYFVYKLIKNNKLFKTDNSTLNKTRLIDGEYKLINLDNTSSSPTFTKIVNNINEIYVTIRNDIKSLHYKGLESFHSTYPTEDIHPFFFRPTEECISRTLTNLELTNRTSIFNKISLSETCGPQFGLVFQRTSVSPPIETIKYIEPVLKNNNNNLEQTFSALKADKIYLLTTDMKNTSNSPINFEILDKYELTQENYLKDIEPKTSSMVRGEPLLEFLKALYTVLTTHVHNINSPYAKNTYDAHNQMEELFKNLEKSILNKSIKIN